MKCPKCQVENPDANGFAADRKSHVPVQTVVWKYFKGTNFVENAVMI